MAVPPRPARPLTSKMNTRLLIPMLCIGAVAFACGPRPHAASEAPPVATVANSSKSSAPLASSLTVSVDGGVELAFHVTNTTQKSMELQFASGQTHDFSVLDAGGREVWRWSSDRMFTQALQTRMLGAGETLTFRERWESAPKGTYTVVAALSSSNHPVETRAEIAVP